MQATHKEVWRYSSMKAVLRLASDGLLRIEAIGLIGADGLAEMARDVVASMALPNVVATVIDLRRASVLIGSKDSFPVVPIPERLQEMPVAIVCADVDEPLFLSHAAARAREGLLRAVFTDPDAASSWALARASGSSAWGAQ